MAKLIRRGERFGREPEYVAVTLTGLEDLLRAELETLGAANCEAQERSVSFRATTEVSYRVLLESRLAMRVLRPLSRFSAGSREELYQRVTRLPWEQLITPRDTFAIRPQSHSSIFRKATFASQVVKDGIVDRQRNRTGRRSSIDSERPALQLQLRIREREVELSLDATTSPLSRRGYRRKGGSAPINEVLAAGLLDLAGWRGQGPLLDPFCGSGTILAEAAIKLYRIPPNLGRREWAHMRWPDFDGPLWEKAREGAGNAGPSQADSDGQRPLLYGVDIDPSQLSVAQENLKRLGVSDRVRLHKGEAASLELPEIGLEGPAPPTIISNLPYGERSGEREEVDSLYAEFGSWLKEHLSGGAAWLLTGNLEAAKSFGLRSKSRTPLYNGPIECRLLEFDLY